jgi:amino acid permease
MFEVTNPLAFIMRVALFMLLFCCFPLVNHFLRSLTFQTIFRGRQDIGQQTFMITTISLLVVPCCVAIFYPKVASVLGIVGAFAGLIIVYILPVITWLKKVKTECEHPLLAKALE